MKQLNKRCQYCYSFKFLRLKRIIILRSYECSRLTAQFPPNSQLKNYFYLPSRWHSWIDAFTELSKATIVFVMSVLRIYTSLCPHGPTQLLLKSFPWNLIFKYFSRIWFFLSMTGISGTWLETLCTFMVSEFILEWEVFQVDVAEKIQTNYYIQLFLSILWRYVITFR
jgi:hypothetical protein